MPATPPTHASPTEYLAGLVGLQQLDDGWDSWEAGAGEAHSNAGDSDTIAAIVTGAAAGAVSIIRLSGSDAVPIAQQVFQPARATRPQQQQGEAEGRRGSGAAAAGAALWEPESHRLYYGRAVDAAGDVLDEVGRQRARGWAVVSKGLAGVPALHVEGLLWAAVPDWAHWGGARLPPFLFLPDKACCMCAQVLLLAMLEPRSYTAEDVIEIHTHGGGISAQRVLQVGGCPAQAVWHHRGTGCPPNCCVAERVWLL